MFDLSLPIFAYQLNNENVLMVDVHRLYLLLHANFVHDGGSHHATKIKETEIAQILSASGFLENIDFFVVHEGIIARYFVLIDIAIVLVNRERSLVQPGKRRGIDLFSYLTKANLPRVGHRINQNKTFENELRKLDTNILTQCVVNGYRIDFFLPSYQLAIEYGEATTACWNLTQQAYAMKNHQQRLEKQGIKFIRVKEYFEVEGIKYSN